MKPFVRGVLTVVVFGVSTCSYAAIDKDIEAPVAEITGQEAATNPDVMTFLGVPYAEPPTDENRWRAPQLITDGRRLRADSYSAQCIQQPATTAGFVAPAGRGFAGQFGGGIGGGGRMGGGGGMGGGRGGFGAPPIASSEDCLYLNIWSGAERENSGAPVMVWIGGEQLVRGSASNQLYNGEALAGRGVVVVNFNYRLGTFGFLAHPALSAEAGTSGNYGLLDAIAALQWINNNIESFGGDPENITIFSGSAGAVMTAALIGSPEAEGLFQKAVLQSGTWMGTGISGMQTLAEAEAIGVEQLGRFGDDVSLKDLRDLPQGQLTTLLLEPRIVVDGRYIPRDLAEIFENGQQNPVSVMVGSNREEGVTFLQRMSSRSADQYESYVQDRLGDLAGDFLRIYPSGTSLAGAGVADRIAAASNVTALGDELGWAMRKLALSQQKIGQQGYVYEFTRVTPSASLTDPPASLHGAEVPYVFNNLQSNRAWTDGDRQLSQVIASYWLNFAETGSPNGLHHWQDDIQLPPWPAYTGADEFQAMELGDRVGTNPVWQIGPEKIELFDQVYESLVLN